LHEESRRLKFENESTARDLSSTKNQLVWTFRMFNCCDPKSP
jgi:hypothetical protein